MLQSLVFLFCLKKKVNMKHQEEITINNLPEELLFLIFSFLQAKDLIKVGKVCNLWCRIVTKDKIFLEKIKELKFLEDKKNSFITLSWKSKMLGLAESNFEAITEFESKILKIKNY